MPQILFYCNPLLLTVIILLNISLNLGLRRIDFKSCNKNINLFSLQISSEGLSDVLINYAPKYTLGLLLKHLSCDIKFCQVKSNSLFFVLTCISTDQ